MLLCAGVTVALYPCVQVYAEALYDYTARSDTELSFKKDQIISNVNKVYEDSWYVLLTCLRLCVLNHLFYIKYYTYR